MQTPPSDARIRKPHLLADVQRLIGEMWAGGNTDLSNPAPNPVSLLRKDLPRLADEAYVVAEKSDGVRYLLVLGRFSINRRPYAALVDRRMRAYQLDVCAPLPLFDGSVFDGEWVETAQAAERVFLVFDAVGVAGRSTAKLDLLQRLEHVAECFATAAAEEATGLTKITCASPGVRLCAKPWHHFEAFAKIQGAAYAHASDGFIFTPVREKVQRGTHRSMFKWKYHPTVDVWVIDEEKTMNKDDRLQVGNPTTQSLREAFPDACFRVEGELPTSACVAEMRVTLDEEGKNKQAFVLTLERVREDKAFANSCDTAAGVLEEVVERIQLAELVDLADQKHQQTQK